jgi:hypothetical protein
MHLSKYAAPPTFVNNELSILAKLNCACADHTMCIYMLNLQGPQNHHFYLQ